MPETVTPDPSIQKTIDLNKEAIDKNVKAIETLDPAQAVTPPSAATPAGSGSKAGYDILTDRANANQENIEKNTEAIKEIQSTESRGVITTTIPADTLAQSIAKTIAADAGVQAAVLTTAGQRTINFIWEINQAIISILVVLAGLGISAFVIVRNTPLDNGIIAALLFVSNMASLVIGFYFSRTNHAAIGGPGTQPVEPYVGR